MKFCSHCGKELMDEAVVCPGCWQPVQTDTKVGVVKESVVDKIQKKKENKKTVIIIIAVLLCIALLTFLISIPVRDKMEKDKRAEIIRVLSAREFSFEGEGKYTTEDGTTVGVDSITYSFDDDGNCHVSFRYDYETFESNKYKYRNPGEEYGSYQIDFSGKKAYVTISRIKTWSTLSIKFDENGDILALYDPVFRQTYK